VVTGNHLEARCELMYSYMQLVGSRYIELHQIHVTMLGATTMCFDAHNWLLDYTVYKPQAVHLPSSLWLLSPTASIHWRKSEPKSGPKSGSQEFANFWPAGKPGRGRQLTQYNWSKGIKPARFLGKSKHHKLSKIR
jgi:hypothetical protein